MGWSEDSRQLYLLIVREPDFERGSVLAAKHRLPALLKRLAAEVDRRMPEDEGGILYRRLMVVGNTESYAAAQKVYETLKERYPETQYARMAELTMRSLARRQQRQGDEH